MIFFMFFQGAEIIEPFEVNTDVATCQSYVDKIINATEVFDEIRQLKEYSEYYALSLGLVGYTLSYITQSD